MDPNPKATGLDLVFREVSASFEGRRILHNISGMVKQGEMLAIMGSTGTGKTTLLNTLMGRVQNYSGTITINQEPITKQHRRKMGYALQEDIFFPNLTLRQTLKFTALLRMPDTQSYDEKIQRCTEVAESLDLSHCLDTVMGGFFMGGLSGGEKKRANIACELLRDPQLILIDEPTSGLDAALAFQVMTTLFNFTRNQNKTIVATIHQPSSKIFHMFDNVLLLADGKAAYYGHSKDVVTFVADIGLDCNPAFNPADFILEKVTKSEEARELMVEATNRSNKSWPTDLSTRHNNSSITSTSGAARRSQEPKWPTSFWSQYKTLVHRNIIQSWKGKFQTCQNVKMAMFVVLYLLIFWMVSREEANLGDKMRYILCICLATTIETMLIIALDYLMETAVVTKERMSGVYRLSAYYLAKLTSELPIVLFYPSAIVCCVYFLTGMTIEPGNFFAFLAVVMLTAFTAQNTGIVIGVVFSYDPRFMMTVVIIAFNFMFMAGGVVQNNVHPGLAWIRYLSVISYSLDSKFHVEIGQGHPFECSDPTTTMFPECRDAGFNGTIPGTRALEVAGYFLPLWADIVILLGFCVGFALLGYVILRTIRHPGKHYKFPSCSSLEINCTKCADRRHDAPSTGASRKDHPPSTGTFDLSFDNLCASIGGKQILKNVSGSVRHGSMMAVLGPSGTGKTTLLNVLMGRIQDVSGKMTANGLPLNKQRRRQIGYVMQQDVFFVTLTVRQTLQFTAELKLPEEIGKREKQRRIYSLAESLGLSKSLDTCLMFLSGGEQKSVSIACELLVEPALLLVDEPTTGLDSSLAFDLVNTLQQISSDNNKAIMTTIHQPSSQIFHMFQKILLLGDGQVVYYGDPHGMVDYLSSLGLDCAPLYNPADFALEQLRAGADVKNKLLRTAQHTQQNGLGLQQNGGNTGANVVVNNAASAPHRTDLQVPEVIVLDKNSPVKFLSYVKTDPDRQHVEREPSLQQDFTKKWPTGFWTQYKTLTRRHFMEAKSRKFHKVPLSGEFVTALLCGVVWWQMNFTEQTVSDLKGLIFFLTAHWNSVLAMNAAEAFLFERMVTTKERLDGTYRLSAYWLAKMTAELPLTFVIVWISWTIMFLMTGMTLDIRLYIGSLFVVFAGALLSESAGLLVATLVDSMKAAADYTITYFLVSLFSSGYLTPRAPWRSRWISYISMGFYFYNLHLQSIFHFIPEWRCSAPENTTLLACGAGSGGNLTVRGAQAPVLISGRAVLEETEPHAFPVWGNVLGCVGLTVLMRVAGYVVLRFIRNPSKRKMM